MEQSKIVITPADLDGHSVESVPTMVVDIGSRALTGANSDPSSPNVPAVVMMGKPKIVITEPSEQIADALGLQPGELLGTTQHVVTGYEPHASGPATITVKPGDLY